MGANKCQFPFLNKKNNKLEYKCITRDETGDHLVCPVKVNEFKKPMKWGYCPENPEITKKIKMLYQ